MTFEYINDLEKVTQKVIDKYHHSIDHNNDFLLVFHTVCIIKEIHS